MWPVPRSCNASIRGMGFSILLVALLISTSVLASALDDVRAGNEFFKAGRLDDAVGAYSNAITSGELQSETLAITYNNRGVALGELEEFARAIEDYEKALQLMPEDATTRKNLRVAFIKRGMALQNQGDLNAAAADFDAAIKSEPEHHLAYLRRAEMNVARGNLALAVSDYKLSLERKPGDADLISALNQAREALIGPGNRQIADGDSEDPADIASIAPTADDAQLQTSVGQADAESTVSSGEAIGAATNGSEGDQPTPDTRQQSLQRQTEVQSVEAEQQQVAQEPVAIDESSDVVQEGGLQAAQPVDEDITVAATSSAAEEQVDDQATPAQTQESTPAPEQSAELSEGGIEPAAGVEMMRTTGAVNVRDAPANSGNLLTTVGQGVELPVLGEELGWKQVRLSNGDTGYIYRRWLEPLSGAQ